MPAWTGTISCSDTSSNLRLIQPLSEKVILAVAFAVGMFICCVSAVANAFLLATGHPAARILMKFDAAGGVIAILLVWRLLRWSRERNQLARERAELVIQLNHEIRNAIQAITLHEYCVGSDDTSAVTHGVARIQRALDRYVPNDVSIWSNWYAAKSKSASSR